jgi:hypothetical protein
MDHGEQLGTGLSLAGRGPPEGHALDTRVSKAVGVARQGPGVFICSDCVELCLLIIAEKPDERGTASSLLPDNAPTEKLLKALAGYNGAFESVGAAMQDIVDILREREVSWAAIGQTLAVSRQAAWKRFG